MGCVFISVPARVEGNRFSRHGGVGRRGHIQDILSNFAHHLTNYHSQLPAVTDRDAIEEYVFEIAEARKMLEKMAQTLPDQPDKATPRELFGFYALIALAQIEIFRGDYKAALASIARINL